MSDGIVIPGWMLPVIGTVIIAIATAFAKGDILFKAGQAGQVKSLEDRLVEAAKNYTERLAAVTKACDDRIADYKDRLAEQKVITSEVISQKDEMRDYALDIAKLARDAGDEAVKTVRKGRPT